MENLEINHSSTIGKLFEALAKAQGQIQCALKDKKNPYFKSSYADLTSVWEACKPALSENGLAVIQTVEGTKLDMFLVTWLGHSSGEWMKSKLPLIMIKQDPQSLGSALTYARRYSLSAMVGVCADDDDDAEKAMNRNGKDDQKLILGFCKNYPEEDHELIQSYLKKYCEHHEKTLIQVIGDYLEPEKFLKEFSKWKAKKETKAA
jgi:ERF superfamily